MKAYELNVGDWIGAGYVSKVTGIDLGTDAIRLAGNIGWFKTNEHYPVAIEPEMFHLNGFSCHRDLDGVATYLHEADDYLVELQAYEEGDHWRVRIQRGPEASVSIKARYVHELQHAMRLMGLHDMANNFKIKEGSEE